MKPKTFVISALNKTIPEISILIRFLHYSYGYGVTKKDFESYLKEIGFSDLDEKELLWTSLRDNNVPAVEVECQQGKLEIDFRKYNQPICFTTDISQNIIYRILNDIEDKADEKELINNINSLLGSFININTGIMNYLVRKAQENKVFNYNNHYALSSYFLKTLEDMKMHIFFKMTGSNFPSNFFKDLTEQLKCCADMLFLTKAIISVLDFPFLKPAEKKSLEKLVDWILIHMRDAVIHKIVLETNPISYKIPPEERKAKHNTTRITIYYQIEMQYSYKLRIDLPHVGAHLPHINFYNSSGEMIGPVPNDIVKKYTSLNIIYQDRCDKLHYFNSSSKLGNSKLELQAKEDIKKYRHNNVLADSMHDLNAFNNLFDDLISHITGHLFFTKTSKHQPDGSMDEQIFNTMKIRGISPLLCFCATRNTDLRNIINSYLNGFSKQELDSLDPKDLIELFHEEIYKRDS